MTRRLLPALAALVLGACGGGSSEADPVAPRATAPAPAPEPPTAGVCLPTATPDGNRLAPGRGSVPDSEPVDVELPGEPAWVVGVPRGERITWVVALADGRVVSIENRGTPEPFGELAPGRPPAVACAPREPVELLTAGSELTHPVAVDGRLAFADERGRLHLGGRSADAGALPDARPVTDGTRALVIGGATDRYAHGVLGDELEGGAIVTAERDGERLDVRRTSAPGELVIEGHAPIWADADGDGARDVVVVLSDDEDGGRPAALSGNRWRVGPGIGQGNRWRHPVAVGPFGPEGEVELVAGRTPHLDAALEFLRLDEDGWRVVATHPGPTTHRLGSRNLDQAVAGDFDGSGRPEAVALDRDLTTVVAVERDGGGTSEAWRLPAGAAVITNLAPATTRDGRLALAAGTADRRLRIWP